MARKGEESAESANVRQARSKEEARVLSLQPTGVNMYVPGTGVRSFMFERVYNDAAGQREVYSSGVRDHVISALNGMNVAVIVYGQTGSGKTHTMFGPPNSDTAHDPSDIPEHAGVIVRTAADVLRARENPPRPQISLSYKVQYVQIYDNECLDLLSGERIGLRISNWGDIAATESTVDVMDDMFNVLSIGEKRKRFAATAMNHRSSRSHTIMILTILQKDALTMKLCKSKLFMVDLAGSERVKKSKVVGDRLQEAISINSSLMTLGNVIGALVKGKSHVPYLESKLTQLLKGAFGGNSKTSVIVTASMDDTNGAETHCKVFALANGAHASQTTQRLGQCLCSLPKKRLMQHWPVATRAWSSLEARGKGGLEVFQRLQERRKMLARRRKEL